MFTVSQLRNHWEAQSQDFIERQKTNPFSGRYRTQHQRFWKKNEEGYGVPVGKAGKRGKKAQKYIDDQISLLIFFMKNMAEGSDSVKFIHLFERYSKISSNLVGLLIRARKRNLIHFEGELLLQRRDDDAIIKILS